MAHGAELASPAAVEATELVPEPGIAVAPHGRAAGPRTATPASSRPSPARTTKHDSLVAVQEYGSPNLVAALHDPKPGAQSDGLATPAGQLRRLLPAAGIVAASAAVTGLAAGTVSPAAGFGFFALLLGGLSLVMIHVLRA